MDPLHSEIKTILFDEFGLDDLQVEAPIFSNNLLSSMDVLVLITALEKKYTISISPFEVTIDMFDSVTGIANIISNKLATN